MSTLTLWLKTHSHMFSVLILQRRTGVSPRRNYTEGGPCSLQGQVSKLAGNLDFTQLAPFLLSTSICLWLLLQTTHPHTMPSVPQNWGEKNRMRALLYIHNLTDELICWLHQIENKLESRCSLSWGIIVYKTVVLLQKHITQLASF